MMRKIIRSMIVIICIVIMMVTGYKTYDYLYQEEECFDRLRTEGIDLRKLHEKNKDIVGWIRIDGTRIDYPVMQRKGSPEYYLRRDFNEKHSTAGTPFLQYDSIIGESKNYLIYGHNIKAGTMFHDLLKYEKKGFYNKHKVIHFETLAEGKQDYEVIAAFRTETYTFNYSNYGKITDEENYTKYKEMIGKYNDLTTDEDISYPNQLITLATCSYHVGDGCGRYLLIGKRI